MNSKKIMALILLVVSMPTFAYYFAFNVVDKNSAVSQFTASIKANPIAIVRFSAQRCGCSARPSAQAIRPQSQALQLTSAQKFTSLSQLYPSIYWLDVSVAQYPTVGQGANVPVGQEALVFYRNGVEIGRLYGNYDPAHVRSLIKQYYNV